MFLYIRMGLVLIVCLFTTRIVLNALGVVDYGIYNVVAGFVTMFSFLNTSMSNGIQRFYNYTLGNKNSHDISNVYNTAIQLQLLVSVILFVLLETFGLWYMFYQMVIPAERMTAALIIFQCSIVSLIIIVLQIPYSAAIMAYEKMDYFAYVGIFDVFAKLAIAYSLTSYTKDKLILYGILHLLVTLTGFSFYFFYCKRNFKQLKFKLIFDKTLFRPMLSFSGWNILGTFAYMLKSQGVNMLLNVFFGPVVNAARGVSNMIFTALQGFQNNIVIAFRPQIVQSYSAGELQRVQILFFSLSKISFLLLSILALPIILELDFILNLWLGNNVPEYTRSFTVLILVNMVVSSLNTPVSQVIHATGNMKTYELASSIIICSIIPISWIFLRFGGSPNMAYIVSLSMTIVNQIISIKILKNVFPYSVSDYIHKVLVPLVLFTLLTPIIPLGVVLLFDQGFFRLVMTTLSCIIISLLYIYFFTLSTRERSMLYGFISRKVKRQ